MNKKAIYSISQRKVIHNRSEYIHLLITWKFKKFDWSIITSSSVDISLFYVLFCFDRMIVCSFYFSFFFLFRPLTSSIFAISVGQGTVHFSFLFSFLVFCSLANLYFFYSLTLWVLFFMDFFLRYSSFWPFNLFLLYPFFILSPFYIVFFIFLIFIFLSYFFFIFLYYLLSFLFPFLFFVPFLFFFFVFFIILFHLFSPFLHISFFFVSLSTSFLVFVIHFPPFFSHY